MEENRYGIADVHYLSNSAICDTKTNNILVLYQICDLLNQQDKRIKALQTKISRVYDDTNEGLRFARDNLQKLNKENQQLKQQISDLQSQLAEKNKEIEELKMYKKGAYEKYIHKCEYLQGQIKDLYKKQNQKAIEQFEKVKKEFNARKLEYITMETKTHIYGLRIDRINELINNQINELKGNVKNEN